MQRKSDDFPCKAKLIFEEIEALQFLHGGGGGGCSHGVVAVAAVVMAAAAAAVAAADLSKAVFCEN